ncbi:hypothetical protein [Chromobacterium violaceum]|uniref:hypothetical protein n=1 Tax=Chromobacterium violaceum TaxID=536 RepID=UPI0009DAF065|nr:hypothetical protein [Chromobacterium violaceum]MBX9267830.1 hypothetical protein [Chromobacterium violaceum]OQS49680.1 hypothetical protein B0T48_06550 [Chromobacterium violaceum]OQS51976.1 hypothetical protein B0T49_08295 [Chromobacterium violaceum]QRO34182.1 hypothetical protein I6K04_05400 [Chromobacterium violaceum]QRQ16015.1 hypothetical protein I6K03_17330 [Chromobacterium violaceum]
MVFDNIFGNAESAAQSGNVAEGGVAGYISGAPAEFYTVPPHDPSKPFTPGPQDPKIVRETSPQALAAFNLIIALTQTLGQAAVQESTVFDDPSTTVSTASPIMSQADQTTSQYPGTTPKPTLPTP